MTGIEIFKTKTTFPEVYDRVFIDNHQLKVEDVTSVFQKFIEGGIIGEDNKKVTPKDGIIFLNSLKTYLKKEGMNFIDLK